MYEVRNRGTQGLSNLPKTRGGSAVCGSRCCHRKGSMHTNGQDLKKPARLMGGETAPAWALVGALRQIPAWLGQGSHPRGPSVPLCPSGCGGGAGGQGLLSGWAAWGSCVLLPLARGAPLLSHSVHAYREAHPECFCWLAFYFF